MIQVWRTSIMQWWTNNSPFRVPYAYIYFRLKRWCCICFQIYFYQNLGIVFIVLHCLCIIVNTLVTSKMADSYFKNSPKEKKNIIWRINPIWFKILDLVFSIYRIWRDKKLWVYTFSCCSFKICTWLESFLNLSICHSKKNHLFVKTVMSYFTFRQSPKM